MKENNFSDTREVDNVFSKAVKAGKRIYYLDVKKARNEDLYVCITESKRTGSVNEGEMPTIEKHKIFLYKEDFTHFINGLQEAIDYVKEQLGPIEDREEWVPREHSEGEETEDTSDETKEKKGLFNGFFKK